MHFFKHEFFNVAHYFPAFFLKKYHQLLVYNKIQRTLACIRMIPAIKTFCVKVTIKNRNSSSIYHYRFGLAQLKGDKKRINNGAKKTIKYFSILSMFKFIIDDR